MAIKWIGQAAGQNHPEAKRIYNILLTENPEYADIQAEEISQTASLDTETVTGADTGDCGRPTRWY